MTRSDSDFSDDRCLAAIDTSTARPTIVRYGVLAFLCSLSLLLYIDRVCIGQAAGSIRADLHLSTVQMSYVYIAFTLAYCLFEVPAGHWGDRFGSRGIIARIALAWSIFTVLTGQVLGLTSLILVQFLFGAGEAGAFPNCARVVTRWFPAKDRGFARGAVTFSSMVGGMIAPVIAAWLIQHIGWRHMFAVFGSAGLVWAALFYTWYRDDPAQDPRVNLAERELIGHAAPPAAALEPLAIPWRYVLASANTYLLAATMCVSAVLFYTEFQWYPSYLKEARGLDQMNSGWLTGIVICGGAIGCVVGGLLSDFVMRRTRERNWSYRLVGGGCVLLAAIAALAVRHVDSVLTVTICDAAAVFFMQAAIPTWWAVVAQISGRHGAAMWGLMNSMSGLGLMGATYLVGRFVDHRKLAGYCAHDCWTPVFDGVGIVLMIGVACWLATNARRSIVEA